MKIYHHNDTDGRCAAAIILRTQPDCLLNRTDLIEVDYKDNINVEAIDENEIIYIADFSFKPGVMKEVCARTPNITWLDHHKTAFEYEKEYPCPILGIRTIEYSGCELAWLFFYPNKPMPRAVALIGDYDKWALKLQPCFEFYEGIKMEDTNPRSLLWDSLLQVGSNPYVDRIIHQGKSAIQYRDNYCSKICHDFGYEIEWDNHYAFATNFYQFGSKGFGEQMDKYDFCIAYIHDGQRFTISLYSIKDVDVSEICKTQGGGGHRGAAGFVCDQLPFKKKEVR